MAREDTEKRKYWEEKINEYKKNGKGKSQNKWCKENKISSRSFNYWYCKFKIVEDGKGENKTKGNDSEEEEKNQTKWISVKVEKDDDAKDRNESGIVINIGKTKIEVNKGFDRESLIDILKVVNLLC